MDKLLKYFFCLLPLTIPHSLSAQGIITTIAGNGIIQYIGDGSPATDYSLGGPQGICVDKKGNVYVANFYTSRISKIAHDTMSTIFGSGGTSYTGDGGLADTATFSNPDGVAMDTAGNFYITDHYNDVVRKVNIATGIITTICGDGSGSYSGDGGPATAASLETPHAACTDKAGNIYIPDYGNQRVRRMDAATGIITTFAGNGTNGYSGDSVQATSAELSYPSSVCFDSAGNVYIAEFGNNRIRRVDAATGIITTVAGDGVQAYGGDEGPATSASLNEPNCVFIDRQGNLYISDFGNDVIRMVNTSGVINTIAGNSHYGYAGDGGPATNATFRGPTAVAVDDSGYIYIADGDNSAIRRIDPYRDASGIRQMAASSFNIYPNPTTSGRFTVSLAEQPVDAEIAVYNTIGQCVYRSAVTGRQVVADLAGHAPGTYYVQYISAGESVVERVVLSEM